ncbi:hypothetical protein COO09_17065 [Rhizorhabdus dicambivorans]|uniref:Uncharacterized protein n=1 Tax=Rhizorhabdus dicambivorans TaxID=1850238 RepID=A0A2A4FUD7_9SPHN|nr:hypothetical protein [Rhizorhabdus dicambivorans]ATE66450.1 hypothetical protein CMV14_20255 [Rhizorhabdus dicambivorans]PCE41058.1 hypothetical protein COO09_17065 [Rhizorhabdus dicambivorans]
MDHIADMVGQHAAIGLTAERSLHPAGAQRDAAARHRDLPVLVVAQRPGGIVAGFDPAIRRGGKAAGQRPASTFGLAAPARGERPHPCDARPRLADVQVPRDDRRNPHRLRRPDQAVERLDLPAPGLVGTGDIGAGGLAGIQMGGDHRDRPVDAGHADQRHHHPLVG